MLRAEDGLGRWIERRTVWAELETAPDFVKGVEAREARNGRLARVALRTRSLVHM